MEVDTRPPATGTVREQQLDDRPGEFPRTDDRLTSLGTAHGHVPFGFHGNWIPDSDDQ